MPDTQAREGMVGRVRVQVHDEDGNLRREDVYPNLWVDNWRRLMAELFGNGESEQTASMDNKGGGTTSIKVWVDRSVGDEYNAIRSGAGCHLLIGDGGGATVNTSRSDNELVNQVDRSPSLDPSTSPSLIAWSHAFANGTGGTITVREVGLDLTTRSAGPFLLMHVPTTATDVADGETVTVTYELTIP